MNLNQLRYFIALGEEKKFTRAAQRCGVSQPSLTNAIRALEDELGGALFYRKPRIHLTALGNALWPNFHLIVDALDETPRIVAAMNRNSAGATVQANTLGTLGAPAAP